MFLHQKISDNLKEAMKTGQEFEVSVFRFLLASLHNKEIEKKGKGLEPTLSDDEIIEVLTKEAKKRKESIKAYTKGARSELAEKEKKELEIIKKFLPEELNREETERIIGVIMEKSGGKNMKDLGRLMGEAMKELKGKADASVVNEIIKKRLTTTNPEK